MAPESERANVCERCGGTPFPSTVSTSMMQFPELYGFCQCLPNFTQATAPNEPTLTCSEVVERLPPTYAEISTFMQKFFGCDYNETHKFGFDEVTRVVYAFCQSRESDSWRERRVQELEAELETIQRLLGEEELPTVLSSRDDLSERVSELELALRIVSRTSHHMLDGRRCFAGCPKCVANRALAKSDEWREQIRKGAKHE